MADRLITIEEIEAPLGDLRKLNSVFGLIAEFTRDFRSKNKTFTCKSTIAINAPPSKVWDALIKPELFKQYLFGPHKLENGT